MPDLWRKDKDKGIWGYGACEVPALLPEMQKGVPGERRTTENDA